MGKLKYMKQLELFHKVPFFTIDEEAQWIDQVDGKAVLSLIKIDICKAADRLHRSCC